MIELSDAYCNRGRAYLTKGNLGNAIADCTEAIRLDPKNAVAYLFRGTAYAATRTTGSDYDKAIADFTEAIRLDPKNAYAYRCRGEVYAEESSCGDASHRAGIWKNHGAIADKRKDWEQAVGISKEGARRRPVGP